MKRFQVKIMPEAGENIGSAYKELKKENPIFAAKWREEIKKAILGLDRFPESHVVAPENRSFNCEIRQLLYGRGTPWRIFFTIEGKTVKVLHVRHGRQNYWGG
jgi:toxin ParE1/3/4